MRKYRFLVEMQNGQTFGVMAFSQREAETLVHAYCILMGLNYDRDVTTCEERGLATRWIADPASFELEWTNMDYYVRLQAIN